MANLSKTLRINFYQNLSNIVEVMIKKFWCVFYASQCKVKNCHLMCSKSFFKKVCCLQLFVVVHWQSISQPFCMDVKPGGHLASDADEDDKNGEEIISCKTL